MANVSYSNDGSRYTVRDSGGNITGTYDSKTNSGLAGTQGSSNLGVSNAHSDTNAKGQVTTQFNQGNSTYNVAPGSIFDPMSPNYNAIVANSNGKITLADLDHSTATGLGANYNGTPGSGSPTASPAANGGFSGGNAGGIGVSQPSYGVSSTGGVSNVQSSSSIQDQINQLKQAQIDAAVAALGKSRDASLSNLGAERATIEPQYYASRNAASTQNQLGAKNFAEFLAQRGQTNSGVANQGDIASNVALQGSLGALSTSEMAANTDIARRETGVGNAYNSDVASANAGANATALQNTITQMNTDRTFNAQQSAAAQQLAIQQAGLTGTYNGQSTLAATQAAQQLALQQAGLTGNYQGQDTLAKTTAAQQLALQQAGVTGTYNGTQTLAAQAQTAQEAYQQQQLALAQQQANAQASQFQQQYGLSVGEAIGNINGNPTLAAKAQQIQQDQFAATQAFQQQQLAASNANAAASRAVSASKSSSSGSSSKAVTQSSSTGKSNTDDSIIEIDRQLANGISPGNIAADIESNRDTLTKQGINVNKLINHVWAGLETTPGEL